MMMMMLMMMVMVVVSVKNTKFFAGKTWTTSSPSQKLPESD